MSNLTTFYLPLCNYLGTVRLFGFRPSIMRSLIELARESAIAKSKPVPCGFTPAYVRVDVLEKNHPNAKYFNFVKMLYVPLIALPWSPDAYPVGPVGLLPIFATLEDLAANYPDEESFTMQLRPGDIRFNEQLDIFPADEPAGQSPTRAMFPSDHREVLRGFWFN